MPLHPKLERPESRAAPSSISSQKRLPELSNFYCHPGRAGGSPPDARRCASLICLGDSPVLVANIRSGNTQNLASPSGWLTCTCILGSSREKKKNRKLPSRKIVGDIVGLYCVIRKAGCKRRPASGKSLGTATNSITELCDQRRTTIPDIRHSGDGVKACFHASPQYV